MPVFRVSMLQSVRRVIDVTADNEEGVWHEMSLNDSPNVKHVSLDHAGATMESIKRLDG